MHELIQTSAINITTQNGPCRIELLFGDITKLHLEEKVDIIMVSAFPGDYAATRGTLIGALHYNLGIGVWKLSMDKELDLRKHFNCWISKLLPVDSPFRRLVCFERQIAKLQVHPAVLVGDVFRGLMPIFNNQDTTMITPLLATGNQNFSQVAMLRSLVDAASNWMKAGLSLRCLKIVMYTRKPDKLSRDEKDLVTLFNKLKNKWEGKGALLKVSSLQYDIYLSCSETDREMVDTMKMILHQQCKDIKVFAEKQTIWAEHVWQEEMFEKMTACKRIVAILTPAYLDSPDCLEQFNIALCCIRLHGLTILTPIYVETVPSMPSYMQLVQYMDCRIQLNTDTLEGKLIEACTQITGLLKGEFMQTEEDRIETCLDYDVFISYSHRNPVQANHLLKLFETKSPQTKVFFDRSELKIGKSWQRTLYQSLDSVRCVIALISSPYLQSSVCQEEYNISLARFLSKDQNVLFIPVCIEDLEEIPRAFAKVKLLDARGEKFQALSALMCESVITWLNTGITGAIFPTSEDVDIDAVCEEYRRKELEDKFQILGKALTKHSFKPNSAVNFPEMKQKVSDACDIYLCYSQDDMRFAAVLYQIISEFVPDVVVSFGVGSPQERLKKLDVAKRVVTFISPTFLKSAQLTDELHIALCRHRAMTKQSLVYAILTSPLDKNPVFLHLVLYSLCLQDRHWVSMGQKTKTLDKMRTVVVTGDLQGSYSCTHEELLALRKAALDISESLLNERCLRKGDQTSRQMVNLLNVVEVADRLSTEENTSTVTLEKALLVLDEETKSVLADKQNMAQKDLTTTAVSEMVSGHPSEHDRTTVERERISPGHDIETGHRVETRGKTTLFGHGHQAEHGGVEDKHTADLGNETAMISNKINSDLPNSSMASGHGNDGDTAFDKKKSNTCTVL